MLSRNRDPSMTNNGHIYAICCRPDVADDVVCVGWMWTIEGYEAANSEIGSSSRFRDITNKVITTMVIRLRDDPT